MSAWAAMVTKPSLAGNMPNGQSRGWWLPSGPGTPLGEGMLVHDALAHRQDRVDHADVDELALAGLVGAQDRADDAEGAA